MKYLNRALEELDAEAAVDEGLVQEVPVSPEEAGKIVDVLETEEVQNVADETIERAAIAVEALTETYGFLKGLGKNVNYSTHALAVSQVQTLTRMVGAKVPSQRSVSVESFGVNQDTELNVALESITEGLKNIWKKIVEMFTRIFNWVREKITTFGQNVEKLKKYRESLKDKIEKGVPAEETKTNGYLTNLICYREGNPLFNLKEDTVGITTAFDRFIDRQGRANGAVFVQALNDRQNWIFGFDLGGHKASAMRAAITKANQDIADVSKALGGTEAQNENGSVNHETHTLPGLVKLVLRTSVVDSDGTISKPASIRTQRGQAVPDAKLPTVDKKFAAVAVGLIDFTIRIFDLIESDLKSFPAFKQNMAIIRHGGVERSANSGERDISIEANVWELAAQLQLYYGVWSTQLCSGLLQHSFGMLKLVDMNLSVEPAAEAANEGAAAAA